MKSQILHTITSCLLLSGVLARGEIKIETERNSETATAAFKFKNIPAPSKNDAAAQAKFSIVSGRPDGNGGSVDQLHDGRVPREEDQPAENFFFNAGTDGGRLQVDLGSVIEVRGVRTYSWHPGTRGPQVYELYAVDGTAGNFNPEPKKGTEPGKVGWNLVARIDTRPKDGEGGGQHGVAISDSTGVIGKYRYFLFDIHPTEETDPFGNTFYSEIDIIDGKETAVSENSPGQTIAKTIAADDGKYQITIDTTAAPDLTEWVEKELAPVVQEWYPKLVAALPSEGFEAPKKVVITFKDGMGGTPAAAGGSGIGCNIGWFRRNLKGEARGSVVHELVHVVQQYGRARRNNPEATRTPGWLTEGIPDYLRWFKYEPQSHGAEITKRNIARAKYDASYRVTANFLNWVTEKYDKNIVVKLNAAARAGKYKEDLWKEYTGKSVQDLGDEWKAACEAKIAAEVPANALSSAEKQAGWVLLFDGKNLDGWHNFKKEGIRPGWQVTNDMLVCVDPHNAGDIVTSNKYDWFELQIDYNISEGGNSGIMYHVTDAGNTAWATGPEIQLEDNVKAADRQRCGWLYQLYQPPNDPKTGQPLDATKPVGQWNHVRVLISPEKCEHEINGVKYFEYVLHSDDFNARVAKSKFGAMPGFAKADRGYLALQGDHGQVSFRNIKVRPIESKK